MMKKFFSIIIPVYNVEKYLKDCLESIKKQTYSKFEVICINDGSTDSSADVLSLYAKKDKRFKVLNQGNLGVSEARNRGLLASKGEYVAFVDSDDWIEATYLKTLYTEIKRNKSDIIVFGGDTFPEAEWADKILNTEKKIYNNDSINALLHENGSIPFMCNKVYKREMLVKNKCLFEKKLSLGEDQAFQFTVFPYAKKISFIPEKLYHYRQSREGSAMEIYSRDHIKKMEAHLKLSDYIKNQWNRMGIMQTYSSHWANWCLNFLYDDLCNLPYNELIEGAKAVLKWFKREEFKVGLSEINISRLSDLIDFVTNDGNVSISIIMPVYNSAEFLPQCLDSITHQSFKQFELICVDDGSKDASLEILREFSHHDKRMLILTQSHQYAGVARNLGLEYASGKYVLFLDSDDFFDHDFLKKIYAQIEKFDSDICVFKARAFDQETKEISDLPYTCNIDLCPCKEVFSRKTNNRNIFAFTTAAPWTKIFRRDFIYTNKIRFQSTRSANDLLFVFMSLVLAEKIVTLDEYLVYYRVNMGTSLQSTQDKEPLAFYDALCALKDELIKRKRYSEIEQSYIVFALDYCLYNLGTLRTKKAFENVFYFLKNVAFRELDIIGHPRDYFYAYTDNNFDRMVDINNLSVLEYVDKYNVFPHEVEPLIIYKPIEGICLNSSIERSFIITKIYKIIFCCYEHGFLYTVKLIIRRLLSLS